MDQVVDVAIFRMSLAPPRYIRQRGDDIEEKELAGDDNINGDENTSDGEKAERPTQMIVTQTKNYKFSRQGFVQDGRMYT